MATGIRISIPTPCHEGWHSMSPNDRGRFCASCQKTVIDFTNMPDREIARILQQNNTVCGHVHSSQLNRTLIIPNKANPSRAAVISLIALTGTEACAQTDTGIKADSTFVMKGVVRNGIDTIPGLSVTNKNTGETTSSNIDGAYSITVHKGDNIVFSFIGYEDSVVTAGQEVADVNMKYEPEILEGLIVVEKKRTFFGRIFHSIGNLFN
jgi:CarboxypepD_reg-like domain